MPSSIVDNDVDTIEYEFAAQGSLHYGLLMLEQAREWRSLAIAEDTGRDMTMAKADALARHAKDYIRGASSTASLLIQSFPDDTDSQPAWQAIRRRALSALYEVNDLRYQIAEWVSVNVDNNPTWVSKAEIQWMALLSNRSFNK